VTTCFVAMGFGEKTAFYGGKRKQRTLNLDKTYENIIKPAVAAIGLKCVRADEILHSTVIDKPMYEQLLRADVVIADISTSNANAIYELGVRHALRPRATVVMAEREFAFPFDLAHLSIVRYEHLGPDIGASEARRASEELRKRLGAVLGQDEPDSPVFVFLPDLTPSTERGMRGTATARSSAAASLGGPSIAELRASIDEATRRVRKDTPSDWLGVVDRLEKLRELQPDDPYVIQQLALATYKSQHPNVVAALRAARKALEVLEPRVSSDGETVGLWGAIHKRLWEAGQDRSDLDEAIRAHERGFRIRNDHYNGINLAFLLDVRAGVSAGHEAIADRVQAARIRREVLDIADAFLADEEARAQRARDVGDEAADGPSWDALRYWVRASRAEALFGLGRRPEADQALAEAKALRPPPQGWMVDSTEEQLRKLAALLSPDDREAAARAPAPRGGPE
jgi:tetratricopeptide (TPR) repeat protein